jgi:hypothetical protein
VKIRKIKYKTCIRPNSFQYIGFNIEQLEKTWQWLQSLGGIETISPMLAIREIKTESFLLRKLERSLSLVSIGFKDREKDQMNSCPIENALKNLQFKF